MASPNHIWAGLNTVTELAKKGEIPSVVNNLSSTSTTSALSAYQGKLLNDRLLTSSAFKPVIDFSGSYTSNGITDSDRHVIGSVSLSEYKIIQVIFSGNKSGRKTATNIEIGTHVIMAISWMDQEWYNSSIYFSDQKNLYNWGSSIGTVSGTIYIRADAGQVVYSVQIYALS